MGRFELLRLIEQFARLHRKRLGHRGIFSPLVATSSRREVWRRNSSDLAMYAALQYDFLSKKARDAILVSRLVIKSKTKINVGLSSVWLKPLHHHGVQGADAVYAVLF